MRKRNNRIVVYLNADELHIVEEKQERSSLSLQGYCRAALMDRAIPSRPCEHHAGLLKELSALSNTAEEILNRIIDGGTADKEVEPLRDILDKTWMLIATNY